MIIVKHKKRTLLMLVLFMVGMILGAWRGSAGAAEWADTYGGTSYSIQKTTDGGSIVAGWTNSLYDGSDDFWVLKLDGSGGVAWQKAYGGSKSDRAYSVQQTTDGGYIVAGETYSSSSLVPYSSGKSDSDIWILKLDKSGTVEWQKTFGRDYYGQKYNDCAYSVQQTTDGGYIVAGTSFNKDGSSDIWILKLYGNGGVAWQKILFSNSYADIAYSIQQTTDGGYIVAGQTDTTYLFSPGRWDDIWILKLDKDGIVKWQKVYGDGSRELAYSVQQTTDGGYIVAGTKYSVSYWDMWVLKLDEDGNVEWQKTYGGPGNEGAYSVRQTMDGGYIVAGYTSSFGANWTGNIWVLKLDKYGTVVWQTTYVSPETAFAYSVQQTTDGDYIVAGGKWVLKLDGSGQIKGCTTVRGTSNVQGIDTYATGRKTNAIGYNSLSEVRDTNVPVSGTGLSMTKTEVCYYTPPLAIRVPQIYIKTWVRPYIPAIKP